MRRPFLSGSVAGALVAIGFPLLVPFAADAAQRETPVPSRTAPSTPDSPKGLARAVTLPFRALQSLAERKDSRPVAASRQPARLARSRGNLSLSASRNAVREVRTTAYTHSEADHKAYGRLSAIGTTLRCSADYTSAASDWSRFPVGTRFRIEGRSTVYVIDDYGSALVGTDTIDLYHPTQASMNRWGARQVAIKILSWGSFDRSRDHLRHLLNYSHCRRMYYSLPS